MSAPKILVRVLLGLLALILLVAGFVVLIATTPWGQQFVTKQVNSYLANRLQSPFRIGRVSYEIPDYIQLTDVLFITPKGDTLIDGGKMRVDLDMWGLLNNKLAINQIDFEKVSLNINRTLPDTTFNFQYIINAFDTGTAPEPADTVSTPMAINLTGLSLKDVRIRYHDDVVGADVNAYTDSLRVNFDETNVYKSIYRLKDVTGNGLNASVRLYEGLPTPPSPPSAPDDTLNIGLGKWQLNRTKWDVRVETADFRTTGNVGRLAMESDYFYLNGEKIGIKSLALTNGDVTATLLKPTRKATPSAPKSTTGASTPGASTLGWQAKLTNVRFANNRIRYDDETAPRQARGLDYSHLDLRDLGIDGRFLMYRDLGAKGQLVSGQLRNGRFRSSSGFFLQKLEGDVLYNDKTTSVTRLYAQTPTSLIRDRLVLKYDSLAQLSDPRFARRVSVNVNLKQSRLSVADVLQLAPFLADTPPFNSPGGVFRANATATGTLAALNLPRLELDMLSGTRIAASGRLTNVTDPDRIGVDLDIREGTTNLADINRLAPPGSIPSTIDLPPNLRLTGKISGALNNLDLNANLATDWGTAGFDGQLAGFVAGKNQTYKGTLNLTDFDAGKWTKQTGTVGKITGRATVNGRGIDVNTLSTTFDLAIQSADLNGYVYKNLDAEGKLTNGLLALTGGLKDPNANLNLDINTNLKGEFPSVAGKVSITELNLKPLKLYSDPLSLKGDINLDMTSTDPARPVGTVSASDAVLTLNGTRYPVDSLYARLTADGNNKGVLAAIPGARLRLNGQFAYDRLYDIVVGEISRYIAVPDLTYKKVTTPYDFTLNLKAYQNPLFRAFVPELTRLDTVRLNARLDSQGGGIANDTSLVATLKTGVVVYDTTTIKSSNFVLRGNGRQLAVDGNVSGAVYDGTNIGPTSLTGTAQNNRFQFGLVSKDSLDQNRHGLAGTLSVVDKNYRFQFARRGLLTNYEQWTADTSGFAQYGKDGVLVDRIRLEADNQSLEVSSTEPYGNAPLRVTTRAIELANLARLTGQDTTLASGQLNGTIVVRDYMAEDSQLAFIGSIYVDSLQVMQKPIGNLTARFNNTSDGKINVNTVLAGPYNDATVTGFYNPDDAKQALNLAINLKRLDARTIEAFSFGELRQAKGQLTGELNVAGSTSNPKLDGSVNFDSVAFNIKQSNATYFIDKEKVGFSGQTVTLDNFTLRDTQNRTLDVDGTVVLKNLPDATYNLRVRTSGFQVLNAARKDNDYAYGQASVSADLRIRGAGTSPAVVGKIRLEDGSKIAVVLPDESIAAEEMNGIVTFVNPKDSLALTKYLYASKKDTTQRKLSFDNLNNANISLDLEVDEKSELTIVVDELNGDYLRARGNAQLNVTVTPAGEISVLGRYDVTEGEYSLTYQILKRQFELQKGGYISFTGDPLKADINLTAVYKVSTPAGDLVGSESSALPAVAAKRKLPFEVLLTISDNLESPKLTFDIQLEEGQGSSTTELASSIEAKLKSLRQDQTQINKQVFALLVLNRFLPENTSDFFSGSNNGGLDTQAEGIARSSVSKLISDQLGRLASNVLKGFDVDFNLLSQTGSTNTGGTTNGARTDLNIGLSKSFLEGRITVAVGRNFLLENAANSATRNPNEIFDNVSVNYNLTRDGRYVLRGYRNNDYQAILDGYIIETGVGFVITIDYNTLSDLLHRSSGSSAAN
ncbi:autotransporter translocation and assembly factor TamB [Spirosoma oryzae]|uniref:Autotransporter translocation and assembly factor TamB n=1 Tax=Spirosoma oryzae TaxID=1469603 RepID=A0A2T0TBR4_9BACT|nr:translocation/assembly module TamB domain-containing protein [Spirosoma oryzae]PRY43103.1 autotransporter translocation and assembly factor TamB [Spirosoma oryzae]